MTSGDLFTVYPVASNALNNPPAAPGALIKKFVEVVTAPTAFVLVNVENPRPPSVACGPSTESPSATSPPKSFTMRKPYCRAQVKPTTYCGKFALGLSVEGPQATLGGRGFSTFTSTNAVGAVTTSTNFFINGPGAAGGLFNAFDATGYTVNKSPDVIVKAAADPGFGHYELLGIISTFRNRIFPCSVVGTTAKDNPLPTPQPLPVTCPVDGSTAPSALGAFDDTRVGGGLGVSGRWPLFNKKLDFGVKGVAGAGIGGVGAAMSPAATVRPDGAARADCAGASSIRTSRRADGPGTVAYRLALQVFHPKRLTIWCGRRSATTYRRHRGKIAGQEGQLFGGALFCWPFDGKT